MKPPQAPTPSSPVQLRSAGFDQFRVTTHEFVRYETIDPSSLHYSAEHGPRGDVGAAKPRALIYRCTETGAERRWGLDR